MAESGIAAAAMGAESPTEEVLLRDRLRRIADNAAGFYAVHLHLSELTAANRAPKYLRIAARTFEPVAANADATLFMLSNSDMVLVCREVPIDEVDNAIIKTRALFSEDPLTSAEEGSLDDHFTTWYDLSQQRDHAALLSIATRLAEKAKKKAKEPEPQQSPTQPTMAGRPLDPSNLAAINRKMETIKLADLINRQRVIEVFPGGTGKVMFDEHFISMKQLQKRVAPGVNLFGSNWLFQYLTETLDKRVLLVIARRGLEGIEEPISLNLNISTVLSREFQQFHRFVGEHAHNVVVELQIIDIFGDMTAYFVARDTLRASGYRVLIDGMSPLTLQYFDPSVLEGDFVKINWNPEFLGESGNTRMNDLREVVRNSGAETVVLARVDSEEAVKWGLILGIHRFQGHFIDTIVEAMQAKGIV